jgi:3-hydroxyacyl-[acyl-carrier-protein] dehydratase
MSNRLGVSTRAGKGGSLRFILIDEIIDLVPGLSIHAVKTLRADEDVFRDHFPGFPVVPGVLLTEMMAQTAGKCLDAADRDRGKAMLVQIRKATFRRWVRPDERADIRADVTSSGPAYATALCRVDVGGVKVASADLTFCFVPYLEFEPGLRDEILERYLSKKADGVT